MASDVCCCTDSVGFCSHAVPLVGTFAYVAPEVLLGRAQVDQAADIFRSGWLAGWATQAGVGMRLTRTPGWHPDILPAIPSHPALPPHLFVECSMGVVMWEVSNCCLSGGACVLLHKVLLAAMWHAL